MHAAVGCSQREGTARAVSEALEQALTNVTDPKLTLVFTTDAYASDEVVSTWSRCVGTGRMAGFCVGAVICGEQVLSQGVVVGILGGEGVRVMTLLEEGLEDDAPGVGYRAGERLRKSTDGAGLVVVLPDGLVPNLYQMTASFYDALGPDYKYVGGGSGDSLRFESTFQFTEKGAASGAIAAAFVGGVQIGTALGHGWQPEGEPLVVTRSHGKRVEEIDAAPAFRVYAERLGEIDRERFAEYGMLHPLGFPDIVGNYVIRDPLSVNDDDSIDFVTEVPRNAVGSVMRGDVEQLHEVAGAVARRAAEAVERPRLGLVFDCVSRQVLMGSRFDEEVRLIQRGVGTETPLLGALTFGEIGSFGDVPLFHNKTVSVAVLGDSVGDGAVQ